jgi:hypothetical protein
MGSRNRFLADDRGPRSVVEGVTAGAVVVPLETIVDIAHYPDVVTIGIGVAAKDVDEAVADAVHPRRQLQSRCQRRPSLSARRTNARRGCAGREVQILRGGFERPETTVTDRGGLLRVSFDHPQGTSVW